MKRLAITISTITIILSSCGPSKSSIGPTIGSAVGLATNRLNECLDSTSMSAKQVRCVIDFRDSLIESGINPKVAGKMADSIIIQPFGETEV